MSDLPNLLAQLAKLDVRVWVEDEKLRLNAPPDVITPELQDTLRSRRDELLAFLQSPAAGVRVEISNAQVADNSLTVSQLSAGQERLYSLALRDPESSVYNIPLVFRLKGQLNVAALEQAFNLIQDRHEALRLVFRDVGEGAPMQEALPPVASVIRVQDLRRAIAGLDTATATAAVTREIEHEVRRPFDLRNGPLWRKLLLRLGGRDHVLAVTMHHIVFDGASKPVFMSELRRAYAAFRDGAEPNLDILPRGFVATVAAGLAGAGKTLDGDRRYWSGQFTGGAEPLMLPTDRGRSGQKGQMRSVAFQLPKHLVPALDAQASSMQSTPFVALFLSVFLTIYRYSQQRDLVICTAMANRHDPVTERLLGYFNNIVPIRLQLDGQSSLRDLLARLRRAILGAMDHQRLPLQDIVSLPDLVRTPLTRALFSYQDQTGGRIDLPGLEDSPVVVRKGVADFELAIYVERDGPRLSMVVDYDSALFETGTIKGFVRHLLQCVSLITRNLDRIVDDLAVVDPLPETVGAVLKSHPQIEDACVVHAPASGTLHAYLVANEYDMPSLPAVREFAAKSFPSWRVPATFTTVDQLPLRPDGTIDTTALPRPARDRVGLSTGYVPPRTEMEKLLVDVWKRVLWIDHDLGVEDRFQELGGHSLLSVQIVLESEKRLRRTIPASCFSSLDTVAEFAAALEAAAGEASVEAAHVSSVDLPEDALRGLRSYTASWIGERSAASSLIIGLNVDGRLPKLFWCLQRYGELTQLAKYLGVDQPVYGMRSANRVMAKTEDNKEMLARYYVSEMLKIQNSGPFFIGGNCQAAEIAFKIARYLQSLGHQIGLLMLHERFVPEPYDGPIFLTFGRNSSYNPLNYYMDPMRGWLKYYSGRIDTALVPGGHGEFFREPNVQVLTATLARALEAVRAGKFGSVIQRVADTSPYRLDDEAYRAEISVESGWNRRSDGKLLLNATVWNASAKTWAPGSLSGLALVGRWRRHQSSAWSAPKGIAPLTTSVAPGGKIALQLDLGCPGEAGEWLLELDMVDEGVTYFSWKGSKPMVQTVYLNEGKHENA